MTCFHADVLQVQPSTQIRNVRSEQFLQVAGASDPIEKELAVLRTLFMIHIRDLQLLTHTCGW